MGTRKYIVTDSSANTEQSKETDLVIFHPSYPKRLREQTHILASGIVAAFSVKMTLNAQGIREAQDEAAALRRLLPPPNATIRDDIISPILFGVLAHSHQWTAPGSDARGNVERALEDRPPRNPREWIDVVCISDLACWSRLAVVILDHVLMAIRKSPGNTISDTPHVQDGLSRTDNSSALGVLVAFLNSRFAIFDPTLRPIAAGLRGLLPDGSSRLVVKHRWELDDALSRETRDTLHRGTPRSPEWEVVYF